MEISDEREMSADWCWSVLLSAGRVNVKDYDRPLYIFLELHL